VDDPAAVVLTSSLGSVGPQVRRWTALLGYDDVKSIRYYNFGDLSAYWTRHWNGIEDALLSAAGETSEMIKKSELFDRKLMEETSSVGGEKYAQVCALAYRQALSSQKLVWNDKLQTVWNFQKEASTDGDLQTMDVIYPTSPLYMYVNPELLKLALAPVLTYANNETNTTYNDPFSPHQLGTYPIADANTTDQEPMPMENTGNMFLMLSGIVRHDPQHDVSFIYPQYWTLLKSWADVLVTSLPFPQEQLCTDDFTGRLANNTNLAAKGIVALEAFAGLCNFVSHEGDECEKYRLAARNFSVTWQEYSWERDHFKIAYDFPNSYSIKYNMVWQKLLGLDGPFDWENIVPIEIDYYVSKRNTFGTPMDSRHNYVKIDWLSWGAAMAHNETSFHALQDAVYDQAHATQCRVPMTDLVDTTDANCAYGPKAFVNRAVVGGVFAKMLRIKAESTSENGWPEPVVV